MNKTFWRFSIVITSLIIAAGFMSVLLSYTIFNVRIYPTIKGGSPVSKLPPIDKTITDLIAQSSPPSAISNANQTLSASPLKEAIECRDVTCAFKDFDFSFVNNNPKFAENLFDRLDNSVKTTINAMRIGNAYSVYNNMIQENIKPDVYTYLSLIIGCASKLDLDLAFTTTDNLKLSIKSSTKIDLDLKLNNYEVALMKSQDVCKRNIPESNQKSDSLKNFGTLCSRDESSLDVCRKILVLLLQDIWYHLFKRQAGVLAEASRIFKSQHIGGGDNWNYITS
nr:2452_t:CDS:2 [Entrophospora candida]